MSSAGRPAPPAAAVRGSGSGPGEACCSWRIGAWQFQPARGAHLHRHRVEAAVLARGFLEGLARGGQLGRIENHEVPPPPLRQRLQLQGERGSTGASGGAKRCCRRGMDARTSAGMCSAARRKTSLSKLNNNKSTQPRTCFMKSAKTSARTKEATPCSPFSSAFRPASSTAAAEESTPSASAAPPAAAERANPPEKQHKSRTRRPAASWRTMARLSRWSA